MDQVTLKPGDYVSTVGMTEEEYHAVAAAFMAAGCRRTHWDEGMRAEFGFWRYILWDCEDDIVGSRYSGEGRHLTIDQVLGAVNATPAADDSPEPTQDTTIATLRLARERLQEAQGAYQLALDAVRAELGEGFVLVEAGEKPVEDMSDPANWKIGDLVKCIDPETESLILGAVYRIHGFDGDGDVILETDANKTTGWIKQMFKFHSRPN